MSGDDLRMATGQACQARNGYSQEELTAGDYRSIEVNRDDERFDVLLAVEALFDFGLDSRGKEVLLDGGLDDVLRGAIAAICWLDCHRAVLADSDY